AVQAKAEIDAVVGRRDRSAHVATLEAELDAGLFRQGASMRAGALKLGSGDIQAQRLDLGKAKLARARHGAAQPGAGPAAKIQHPQCFLAAGAQAAQRGLYGVPGLAVAMGIAAVESEKLAQIAVGINSIAMTGAIISVGDSLRRSSLCCLCR